MNDPGEPVQPLTRRQRRLVRENIGLVGVHLRRYVANLSQPRRDREWEDLFQEGCLGLIRAAVAYREERGIAFAAFALPRIHNAVSRAIQQKFSTIRLPVRRASCDPDDDRETGRRRRDKTSPHSTVTRKVHQLSDEQAKRLADHRRHDPGESAVETIGDRLRGKYERAVRTAAGNVSTRSSRRGDRAALIDQLVEERFLIPHEESKTALRQIARQTRSSYARVAQCDKQLGDEVRRILEADPEFDALTRQARSHPDGGTQCVDETMERDLARTCADEFLRRYRRGDAAERTAMLNALLRVPGCDIEKAVHERIAHWPADRREQALLR